MFDLIRDDLELFERRLASELESEVQFIQAIVDDLVGAGGKRLRPALAFLAARALDVDHEIGQRVALTVEMLHSASLLHDDLIDGAELRRGREAAFRRYGTVVSVMTGDYILARVLRLLSQADNAEFTLLVSHTAARVCEGEVLQHEMTAIGGHSLDGYRRVIEGKTAELLAAAVEGVAVLGGASEGERQALRAFGMRYGRAFQIQDDYLDLMGDEVSTGKSRGSDLREGRVTFPLLLLLERGDEEARRIVARRGSHEGDVGRVAQLVKSSGVDVLTREQIAMESRSAIEALDALPDVPARRALAALAARELERAS